MENKELKKPIPVELDDDALDTVSGGTEPSQDEKVIGEGMPSFSPSEHMIEFLPQMEYKEDEKGSN